MQKKEKQQLTILLGLSRAIALESYDRMIETGTTQNNNQLPENDYTATCTLICLKILEKSFEEQPVLDEEIYVHLTTISTFSLMIF